MSETLHLEGGLTTSGYACEDDDTLSILNALAPCGGESWGEGVSGRHTMALTPALSRREREKQ
jgi:hypothetical protein